jgi:adenosylhomocysteine nucleosidase
MELLGNLSPDEPLLVVAVHLEAEHLHSDHPVLVTGVGKVAASTSLLSILALTSHDRWPSRILNVGTAGALRDGMAGTHVIGEVHQHDLDGRAIAALCGLDPTPPLVLGDGPVLATGDAFISDPAERTRLGGHAALCDMEGYAVAAAAKKVGLEVHLVKHISDDANEEAGGTWVESVSACSESLGLWLKSQHGRSLLGG